ncbi:MAG: tetratricopeptide repeat protein [Aminipila sp.]
MLRYENEQKVRRKDRVKKYLQKYFNEFVFDELSESFIHKLEMKGLMESVPVPLRKQELEGFAKNKDIKIATIAENMAIVIGIDPEFKYVHHYMAFLIKLYNEKLLNYLVYSAEKAIKNNDLELACIFFRTMQCFNEESLQGLYGYAKLCRDIYLKGGDEEFVGNFKAESIECFEILTVVHPEFLPAYYFLGYAYLNLGLYAKADLTWKHYVNRVEDTNEKKEIEERLRQLEIPVKIEIGCNDIMSGRYEEGIFKLEPYTESEFNTWWPLFYYLGISYSRLGEMDKAITSFKRVLLINPGHIDTMEELAEIYSIKDDVENYQKYTKKIELIKSQI